MCTCEKGEDENGRWIRTSHWPRAPLFRAAEAAQKRETGIRQGGKVLGNKAATLSIYTTGILSELCTLEGAGLFTGETEIC